MNTVNWALANLPLTRLASIGGVVSALSLGFIPQAFASHSPPVLPITAGIQAGSYKSIPEDQKGGSVHMGEGLKADRAANGAASVFISNGAIGFPVKSIQCKIQTLKKLGWEVDQSLPSNSRPSVQAQSACYARSMDEIRRNHLLRITLPANVSRASDLQKATDAVDFALTGEGTICAYETYVSAAVTTATTKLFENHFYAFANIFGSGSARMGSLPQYWTQVSCVDQDKCWQPLSAPSYALSALYTTGFSTECATGLQVAEYEMINELFGTTEFNRHFRNEELYVGDWDSITASASVIHGRTGRRYMSQDGGVSYAKAGPQMLVGVSGYIGNVLGDNYLDVSVDRGENMLIVRTSDAAAQSLLMNGGMSYYNLLAHKIWELGQGRDEEGLRQLSLGRKIMASEDADTMQLRQMLTDPFLRDTIVYVHDIGFRSIAQHLLRLLKLNPRTPYEMRFYAESVHGEIFDRWLQVQLDNCDQP